MLSVAEVATRLAISRATTYRLIESGQIPALPLGGIGASLRINEAELEAWLRDRRITIEEEPAHA
jgi:excisionase family DNA binding protein